MMLNLVLLLFSLSKYIKRKRSLTRTLIAIVSILSLFDCSMRIQTNVHEYSCVQYGLLLIHQVIYISFLVIAIPLNH